jgi:hypothetical protein
MRPERSADEDKKLVNTPLSPRKMKFNGDEPMIYQWIISLGFQKNSKLSCYYQVRQNRALLFSINYLIMRNLIKIKRK